MRFGINDAEKYKSQGTGVGYFSIKNDREVKRVRFLLEGIEDLEGYCVHKVKVGDYDKYVNCLHEYGQPKDDCPFCAAGLPTQSKYFIPLYNIDEGKVQIWERGITFGAELQGICARYPHLFTHGFEIERYGKPGDQKTQYKIWPAQDCDDPNLRLDDFELPEILGKRVLDKSLEEMDYYLDKKSFPEGGSAPMSRRPSYEQQESREERPYTRRPSMNGSPRF